LCSGRLSPLKATVDTRLIDVGAWMAGQFDANQSPEPATV
jgi:simple sugar transport system ATP-binding protein